MPERSLRQIIATGAALASLMLLAGGGLFGLPFQSGVNSLTAEEKEEGWRLLFDGESFEGWRGFKSQEVPQAWKVEEGSLAYVPGQDDRGDIMTQEEFQNFELRLQWKISPGGNSGIFFHVSPDADWSWETGPEMQVLDNAGHADGAKPETSAGSNYALHAPSSDVTRPVGEWNQVRLMVDGPHVEHWLNGVKIVEYELWSEDWKQRVQASKFKDMKGYGKARRGHIVLQDHGDKVWFRDIKIRVLD
ncbi:MAG TPA: DUF1080 domain-containing protein [Acidobacteriota bacterium]|nr:DUF1080 domain-containing protein [Acidobacteriota bacterium]